MSAYLLGLVGFRFRHVHTINRQRLAAAILVFALLPVATNLPALATLAILTTAITAIIAYETRRYGEGRGRVRHEDFVPERLQS